MTIRQEYGDKDSIASCKGFTLIEVLMVIAVIGILSAIAVPAYSSYAQKARASAAVLAVGVIQKAIAAYYVETGTYPASLADVGMDTMRDPWGNPYQYLRIAGASNTDPSNSGGSSGGSSTSSSGTAKAGSGAGKSNANGANGSETNASNASTSAGGSATNGGTTTGQARKDRFLVPINSDYDLYSMGPDGMSASPLTAKISQDDIIRASDGLFIGRACDF
jgi:general secretion pathway protein G